MLSPCGVPWCVAMTTSQYCKAHELEKNRPQGPPPVQKELQRRYDEETARTA